jgi:hypothetical protein
MMSNRLDVRSLRPAALAMAAAALQFTVVPAAYAQTQDEKGVAIALFEQGRERLAHGDYEKAAADFEGASKILHTFGILYNLADCYEKLGRTASALFTWRDAQSVASAAHKKDDEGRAAEREKALAPKISYLTLTVPQGSALSSLEVTRNGDIVPRAAWGIGIPVDPGEQALDAHAAGYRSAHLVVVVRPDGDKQTANVPPLDPEPATPTDAAVAQAAPPPPAEVAPAHASHAQTIAGWVAVGAGAVAGIVGIVEWRGGQGKIDDAVDGANAAVATRNQQAYDAASSDLSSGVSQRTAGFVFMGIGGAVVATGVVLVLAAPRKEGAAPSASIAPMLGAGATGLVVNGRW